MRFCQRFLKQLFKRGFMPIQNVSKTSYYDIILKIILSILTFIASVTLCALILITCIDVIGRYFLNAPLLGSTELTEMTLGILVFTSLPIVSYYKKHIVVDVLENFISDRMKRYTDILSYIMIAGGVYAISAYSEKLIQRAFKRGLVTEYLEIPTAYIIMYAQFMGYVTAVLMVALILRTLCKQGGNTHAD